MSEAKLTVAALDLLEAKAKLCQNNSLPVRLDPYVVLSLIAAARELETRWIPVTERLPEKTDLVIAANKHGSVSAFWWDGRTDPDAFAWRGGLAWRNGIVTHWMPLPKGPTK